MWKLNADSSSSKMLSKSCESFPDIPDWLERMNLKAMQIKLCQQGNRNFKFLNYLAYSHIYYICIIGDAIHNYKQWSLW